MTGRANTIIQLASLLPQSCNQTRQVDRELSHMPDDMIPYGPGRS